MKFALIVAVLFSIFLFGCIQSDEPIVNNFDLNADSNLGQLQAAASIEENFSNNYFEERPNKIFFEGETEICENGESCPIGGCGYMSVCDIYGGCEYASVQICNPNGERNFCNVDDVDACAPVTCQNNCGGYLETMGYDAVSSIFGIENVWDVYFGTRLYCSCASDCSWYGECCPDYEEYCTHTECNLDFLTCESIYGESDDLCEIDPNCYDVCDNGDHCQKGGCNNIKACTVQGECEEIDYTTCDPTQSFCQTNANCVKPTCQNNCSTYGVATPNSFFDHLGLETFYNQNINDYLCYCYFGCQENGTCCPDAEQYCTHMECNSELMTCERVDGAGANTCTTNENCYEICDTGEKCQINGCKPISVCDIYGNCDITSSTFCDPSNSLGCVNNPNSCVPPTCQGNCDNWYEFDSLYPYFDLASSNGVSYDLFNSLDWLDYRCYCDSGSGQWGYGCPDYFEYCTANYCNYYDYQCVTTHGDWVDECTDSQDCSHTECNFENRSCDVVFGSGDDECQNYYPDCEQCNTDADCGQGELCGREKKCCPIEGGLFQCSGWCNEGPRHCYKPENEECQIDADCVSVKHNVCQNMQCVPVDGAGADECKRNSDCTNTICLNAKCESIAGTGMKDCIKDEDCFFLDCDDDDEGFDFDRDFCLTMPGMGKRNDCETNDDCVSQGCPKMMSCSGGKCIEVCGNGANSCNSDQNCIVPPEEPNYRSCNANKQCIIIEGDGVNSCNIDADCEDNPITHFSCNENLQCIEIDGDGQNSCNSDSDCVSPISHFACNNDKQCIKVDGDGNNSCNVNNDCVALDRNTYNVCNENLQCIVMEGVGISTCDNDYACGYPAKHRECNTSGECVLVLGGGNNTCDNDSSCESEKMTYNKCNEESQCIVMDGEGISNCNNDYDCVNCNFDGECNSLCENGFDLDCFNPCINNNAVCDSGCTIQNDSDCPPCINDDYCNPTCQVGLDPNCDLGCTENGICNLTCASDPDCDLHCFVVGEACTLDSNCCSNDCASGFCGAYPPIPTGQKNSISILEASYKNNTLNLVLGCTFNTDSNISVIDSNSKLIYFGKEPCLNNSKKIAINLVLENNQMYSINGEINSPCWVCNREAFVYVFNEQQRNIPDWNIFSLIFVAFVVGLFLSVQKRKINF